MKPDKALTDQSPYTQLSISIPCQGSVLGPSLYTIFTADIPKSQQTSITTLANDTEILSKYSENPFKASADIQHYHSEIKHWLQIQKIKNEYKKSAHFTFAFDKPHGDTTSVVFFCQFNQLV